MAPKDVYQYKGNSIKKSYIPNVVPMHHMLFGCIKNIDVSINCFYRNSVIEMCVIDILFFYIVSW